MISIIIPTLNEEKYLPFLLESIKKQKFSDYEIIVADAGSTDKTIEIAKRYGCRITNGGLPAVGRNNGAKIARGDLFLFLDADIILPEDFFEKALKEFRKRNLDIATCCISPLTKKKIERLFYRYFYNIPIKLTESFLAHGSHLILVKKDIHKKIGGFDPEIKLAEDHIYARMGAKIGKSGVLRSSKIFTWPRRFYQDGWIRTGIKYALAEIYTILFGPLRSNILKYKFNHYSRGTNSSIFKYFTRKRKRLK